MKYRFIILLAIFGLTGCASSLEKSSERIKTIPDDPQHHSRVLPKELEHELKRLTDLEGKKIAYTIIVDIEGKIKVLKSEETTERTGFPITTNKIIDANSILLITHEGSTCVTKVVNGMSRTVCY